jgi:hypothetical protein
MLANEVMVTLLISKGKQSIRKMQGAKYGFGPTCPVVTDVSKIEIKGTTYPKSWSEGQASDRRLKLRARGNNRSAHA